MKNCLVVATAFGLVAFCGLGSVRVPVYPQAFDAGGWKLDCQFMDQIGSPYLLAHGIGQPCVDARARVNIPEVGRWRVRVRSRNWERSAPGKFIVRVNGRDLGKVLGEGSDKWSWEDCGEIELQKGVAEVVLHDLTGFDGRCAGVLFELDCTDAFNGALTMDGAPVDETVDADLVVVGGGLPGCAATLAAARSGLKVVLVHDRPVLGGNASSEVRVWCAGEIRNDIVAELRGHYSNKDGRAEMYDARRRRILEDEPNVDLRLHHRAFAVAKDGDRIGSVRALDLARNRVVRFRAPIFLDSTGDGWIGYWAGAEYRMGREASSEHNELMAPEKADGDTLGASLMWTSSKCIDNYHFSAPWAEPWAQGVERLQGDWNWEYGIHRDMIADAEQIRDRLFLAVYGAFSLAKRRSENSRYRIDFLPHILGKRESRRLLGDWILTESDVSNRVEFADAIASTSWSVDLHYDDCQPGVDYLTTCRQPHFGRAWVPFRSLYSRNVPNLLMAGRCFSCTHIGLGAPRVMNTLAQTGVAAGYAAAICKREGILPRDVYAKGFVREIQRNLGGAWPGVPDPEKAGWLIVDDEDSCVVLPVGWRVVHNDNGGQVGQVSHRPASHTLVQPAVYPLPVCIPGNYELKMNIPYDPWFPEKDEHTGKAVDALVEIVTGEKVVPIRVCQGVNIGTWVSLGRFRLKKGDSVRIVPEKAEKQWMVYADAFAIVPIDEKGE